MTDPLRLYTFSISHFSEKIRWTLGLEKIPFVEIPWAPPFHVMAAQKRGRGSTVPIVETDQTSVQDSTRILHWLDENRGPLTLLSTDEAMRKEALEIEARFDSIGGDVMRLAYAHVLDDTAGVVRLWTIDATPMQTQLLKLTFPIFRMVFRRRLDTSAARVAKSREQLEAGLAFIEERTRGQRYLVGDRLGIADVTAAALLAPFACPDEHPVYGHAAYRAGIAPIIAAYGTRPAFDWVRALYRDHRGPFARAALVTAKLDA